jgi:hypothetical protein
VASVDQDEIVLQLWRLMDDVAGFGDNKIDLGTIDVRGAAIFDDAIRNRLIWHDASMSAAVGRKDNGTQPAPVSSVRMVRRRRPFS